MLGQYVEALQGTFILLCASKPLLYTVILIRATTDHFLSRLKNTYTG